MADAESVERFQREASVCANIDSDHVVGVIDCDVDAASGMPFLVMELLNGKDLSQYIAETWGRGAPIPASMVLSLVRQVASALDKVHAHGIVHRDLKPANLFLTFPSDSAARVKILDFGVAKLTREKRTSNATRLGTPLYMAAEQLSVSDSVSPATDVWALALITYELLVGVPYWEGNTAASLLERIPDAAQHPAPSMLAGMRGVLLNTGFDHWLLRCIDPSPARRPATAGEAVGELLRLYDPNATQPPSRALASAPVAPIAPELGDTRRESLPSPRTSTPSSKLVSKPQRPAQRSIASDTIPMPTVGALMAARAEADEAAKKPTIPPSGRGAEHVHAIAPTTVDASEKPTIPASGRQVVSRVRDPSETRTTKMPVVQKRVRTVDAVPPPETLSVQPTEVQPLAFSLSRPRTPPQPSSAAAGAPNPVAAPPVDAGPPLPVGPARAAPKDRFAQRISQAAAESEAAVDRVASMRRLGVAPNALTTLLPVAPKRARGVSTVTLTIVALAAVAVLAIAAVVVLRRREAPPMAVPPRATTELGVLDARERRALRTASIAWSSVLRTQQNADGGFGAQAGAMTNGGDTATRLAALVRGHVVGATVAPAQQLRALQALDAQRLPEGWGFDGGATRRATSEATAWATIAYAHVAQESRAETARMRVQMARTALMAAQHDDGGFSEGVLAMGTSDARTTSFAAWALYEASRAAPTTDARTVDAHRRALARALAFTVSDDTDFASMARTFWTVWRARREVLLVDPEATGARFAQMLLARCALASGCGADVDPWVALAAHALVRESPQSLSLETRRALVSLRTSIIARAPTPGGNVGTSASAWLLALAELQR
jgi:serine/threonine-protein kinase